MLSRDAYIALCYPYYCLRQTFSNFPVIFDENWYCRSVLWNILSFFIIRFWILSNGSLTYACLIRITSEQTYLRYCFKIQLMFYWLERFIRICVNAIRARIYAYSYFQNVVTLGVFIKLHDFQISYIVFRSFDYFTQIKILSPFINVPCIVWL